VRNAVQLIDALNATKLGSAISTILRLAAERGIADEVLVGKLVGTEAAAGARVQGEPRSQTPNIDGGPEVRELLPWRS
jgi:hypothetical protein